jgi:hypothetical protein
MADSRIEELLERIIEQNDDLIQKFGELLDEVRDINRELNWVGDNSFAKMVIDGLDSIERAVISIDG